jgi:hypothetical protein
MKKLIFISVSVLFFACTTPAPVGDESSAPDLADSQEYLKNFSEPTEPFQECKFERLVDSFGSPDGYKSLGKCKFTLGPTPQYCEKVESCEEGSVPSVCRSVWNPKRNAYEALDNDQLPKAKLGEEITVEADVTIKNRDDLMVDGCVGSVYSFKKVRVTRRDLAQGTNCFDVPLQGDNTKKSVEELTASLSEQLNLPVKCESKAVCDRALARQTKSPLLKLCVAPAGKDAVISDVKKSTVTSIGY